jgi:hypothetical protein
MHQLPRIIAVCGVKRSGKDTIADALCERYGYQKIKVSEGLKDMLKLLFGFSDDQLESDQKDMVDPKLGVTPRKIMQFMGTDVMQFELQKVLPCIGRTFWIKQLIENHIEKNPGVKYVISDMRFIHEFDTLRPHQPFVIRVERDSLDETPCGHVHISETEYKNIPYNVLYKNNGTLEDVSKFVTCAFNQT